MPDEQKLDLILERFYNRYNKFNTKVLKKFGEVIAKFDGVTPSEAHILAQELKYSTNIDKLMEDLSKLNGKSIKDIDKFFDYVAEQNVEFAEEYYKYRDKEYIEYNKNTRIKDYVNSVKESTNETFKNIADSSNVGFSLKDANGNVTYKSMRQAYNNLIDEAALNVSMGVKDYGSAMRGIMNQLADSGVKIHQDKLAYKSGYNRRIDSSIRQDVLTGVRKINLGIQEQIGKELGTDGIEISAHSPCALDHLPYQGRQYTQKEFEEINSELSRPIGEGLYNCHHFVFSVILGVQEQNYTDKQLQDFEDDTLREITYKGKTYNAYEATQVQRRIETAIRQQKDRQIIARAGKQQQDVLKAQQNITKLTSEYKNFSKVASLRTYMNRLTVTGYQRVKA